MRCPIARRRSRSGGTIRTCELCLMRAAKWPLLHPRSLNHKTTLVHARGFEPPKPGRVTVLQTAAANRICLTCTHWRKVEGSNPDLVLGGSPGFQDQSPATPAAPSKLVFKQMAASIRFERMTPMRCSALAVRRLRPLGQLSEFNYLGAGRGHRTPTSEDTAS